MDLVIEGKAFIDGGFRECAIGIENGKISKIGKIIEPGAGACRIIKAKKILPAGIDVHVHFRDPGLTYKEDFFTGTLSAAHGGISCVLDMPNTVPSTTTREALEEKIKIAESKACVDFGIYAGASADGDFKKLAERCTAFKLFMAESTGGLDVPDDRIEEICERIAETGKILSVHAEDKKKIKKLDERDLKHHLRSRPNVCEAGAVKRIVKLAPALKNHIHLCHISAIDSLEYLRKKPSNITAEVTPHHLFLDADMHMRQFGKVNPPLRTKVDRIALWQALSDGRIDMIASDHAPHTIEEKEQDFASAPSGMPGVETMYPLMLMAVKDYKIRITDTIKAICEAPAQTFGFRKGRIALGYDADLILVDFQKVRKIHADDLHSRCGWTAFEGAFGIFPECTMVRGEFVIENGEFAGKPGYGKFVGD